MVRKQMSVNIEPFPALSFTPPPDAEFSEILLPIPELADGIVETEFRSRVERTVQWACGRTRCDGNVIINSTNGTKDHPERHVLGALIYCDSHSCPLDGPDGSGDQEPLLPPPKDPEFRAVAEAPPYK